MTPRLLALWIAGSAVILSNSVGAASATDLYKESNWSSMVADRRAQKIGDSITVVIYETSTAKNTAKTASKRDSQIGGQIQAGTSSPQTGMLGLNSKFDTSAQMSRSGTLVAEISVIVDALTANGDLHVNGEQIVNISGEKTRIHVSGRIRPEDVASDDTVISSRLADARIEYSGKGLISSANKRGFLSRITSWFGLP